MENVNKNETSIGIYKDAFLLTLSTLLTKVIGVFFKIPLSYILTDEGLGYFNTAYSVYVFFYVLCTAGIPKAITLIITREREDSLRNLAIIKKALSMFLLIGILACVLLAGASPYIGRLVKNERVFIPLLFIAPSLAFVSVGGVIRGYLAAVNKLSCIAISQIIEATLKLILGLGMSMYAVKLSLPLYYISGFAILGVSLGSITSCLYLYSKIRYKNNGRKYFLSKAERKNIAKDIIKIALPISISAAVLNLSTLIDIGLIMRGLQKAGYTSLEATALYGNYSTLVVPISNLIISLITPFTVSALPRLSRLYLTNKRDEYTKQFNELMCAIMFFVSHIITILVLYSNEILDVLFPSASAIIASPLLSCLSPAFFLLSAMTILNTAIEGTGDVKTPLKSIIAVTVIKVAVSYYLIGERGLGIMAIPIGNIIAYCVGVSISLLRMISLRIKQNYIVSVIRFCLISMFSIAATHLGIYNIFPISLTSFSFMVAIMISTILYIFLNAIFDKNMFYKLKKVILNKNHNSNLSNKTN